MTLIIQWIDCGGGTWESAEGRFVIFPHVNGAYVRDRLFQFIHPEPGDSPVQTIKDSSEVFATEDDAKAWAHHRLEVYWHS